MNQFSKMDEILASIKSGGVDTLSVYRDESAQTKTKVKRIASLKKEPKKKSKLLFITDLAIPFNPATGKEDEVYNKINKCRPIMATETAMLMYKKLSAENEATKKAFMVRAGVDNWDLSNINTITEEDKVIFNRYRYPMIFTLNACNVNIPSFTGNKFGRDYKVDVVRDKATGSLVGEMPVTLKLNKFLGDLVRVEVEELEAKLKSGELDLNDEDKKKAIGKLYNGVVVGSDRPVNYALALEIPLASTSMIKNDFQLSELENADIMDMLRLVRVSTGIREALGKYQDGSYMLLDKYSNFWEFDMLCSNDEDPKDLGRNTTYEKAMMGILEHKEFGAFNTSVTDFMNNNEQNDLEKKFLMSAYVTPMTSELENNLLDAVSNIIKPTDVRLNEGVRQANADIIPLLWGEEVAMELLGEAEMGMAPEGGIDEEASMKMNRMMTANKEEEDDDAFDINALIDGDDDLGA